MGDRLQHIAAWGLPPSLMSLARGELPHPAFEALCEPVQSCELWQFPDLDRNQIQTLRPVGELQALALWEKNAGDGHSFEVMYFGKRGAALEFVHVVYADDIDGPLMKVVARSAQGLYFWLFFHLIQSEFFLHGEAAYSTIVAASKAVGFNFLIEVFGLEQEIGTNDDRFEKLHQRSIQIM